MLCDHHRGFLLQNGRLVAARRPTPATTTLSRPRKASKSKAVDPITEPLPVSQTGTEESAAHSKGIAATNAAASSEQTAGLSLDDDSTGSWAVVKVLQDTLAQLSTQPQQQNKQIERSRSSKRSAVVSGTKTGNGPHSFHVIFRCHPVQWGLLPGYVNLQIRRESVGVQ